MRRWPHPVHSVLQAGLFADPLEHVEGGEVALDKGRKQRDAAAEQAVQRMGVLPIAAIHWARRRSGDTPTATVNAPSRD